jgi:hypothetical protein
LIVDLAQGNLGHLFEPVAAARLIDSGFVPSGYWAAGTREFGKESDWSFTSGDLDDVWVDVKWAGNQATEADILAVEELISNGIYQRAVWATLNGRTYGGKLKNDDDGKLVPLITDANRRLNTQYGTTGVEYIRLRSINVGDM